MIMSTHSDIEGTIEACRLANIEWQKDFEIGKPDDYNEMCVCLLLDDIRRQVSSIKDSDYVCSMILRYDNMNVDYQERLDTLSEDEFVDYIHCIGILGVLLEI